MKRAAEDRHAKTCFQKNTRHVYNYTVYTKVWLLSLLTLSSTLTAEKIRCTLQRGAKLQILKYDRVCDSFMDSDSTQWLEAQPIRFLPELPIKIKIYKLGNKNKGIKEVRTTRIHVRINFFFIKIYISLQHFATKTCHFLILIKSDGTGLGCRNDPPFVKS